MSKLSELFQNRNQTQSSTTNDFSSLFTNPTPQVTANSQPSKKQTKNITKQKLRKTQIQEQVPQVDNVQQDQKQESAKTGRKKDKKIKSSKQTHQNQEPQNLQTTIFVGNVPLSSTHKQIKKLFSKYGQVQKVWFRSIPVENNKIGTKASHILKKYQDGADSMNAYVKFVDVDTATKACQQNGSVIGQHTLRVTMCMDKQIDYKRTVFVGNLPFDIKQEQFRRHFQKIGPIDNLRLVKHKVTKQGIGIGYIKFNQDQDMKKAISQLNGSTLKNRTIRVKRAIQKQKLEKKIRKLNEKKQKKQQNQGKPKVQFSKNYGKPKMQFKGPQKRKIISKSR